MKVAEPKSTATLTRHQDSSSPFFQKQGGYASFGEREAESEAFFKGSGVQAKLKVGGADDAYEKEAEQTADRVVEQLSSPKSDSRGVGESASSASAASAIGAESASTNVGKSVQPKAKTTSAEEEIQKKESEEEEGAVPEIQRKPIFENDDSIQRSAEGESPSPSPSLESQLTNSKGGGSPLPADTQSSIGEAIGADLSGVRVHDDQRAQEMNQELGSQAFTHTNNIYFSEGKYEPTSQAGQHLLAHELTHTVQQGGTVQRKLNPQKAKISSGPEQIQGFGIQSIRNEIGDFTDNYMPAYSMISVVAGYDFIRGKSVTRNRENIIKGVFSLINPWGSMLRKHLEERGIINDAFNWIDQQMSELGLTYGVIQQKWNEFWAEKDFIRWDPIEYNFNLIKSKFGPFVRNILTFVGQVSTKVFDMIRQAFLKALAGIARAMGGYDLLVSLLGKDPITGEAKEATTADILRGILQLPVIQAIGGDKLLAKLEELGLIEKAATWIDVQWALLKGAFSSLLTIGEKFLSLFSWDTLSNPMKFVNELKDEVLGFVSNVISFFKNAATALLKIIKEVMIYLLKTFVDENTYGFDLVKVILGKDPFTGEKVPRSPKNLIKAFIKLLPGGDMIFQQFEETGAIDQMLSWINTAVEEFVVILSALKEAFVNLWQTASIEDLFDPIGFFQRIVDLFKKPLGQLLAFVKKVVMKLIEVLLAIMKFPLDIAGQIINSAAKAFADIKKDPVGFFLNLLKAVKEGFASFFDKIGTHLLKGIGGWLFGQLAKTGIQIPKDFSLGSILDLVMQVLGMTMDRLWERLAKRIGQKKVDKIRGAIDKLVGVWTFVTDVVKNGISSIWTYIKDQISGLWNMILDSAKDWVITKIIQKVTTKLLSMLDPTGIMAVVNGFLAVYNAIQSFIEHFKEMLGIVNTFVGGLAEIAKGTVSRGAQFLENALAEGLPIAIGFLANQVGLGNIGDKVREIIQKIQGYINQGIDWLLDKAMKGIGAIKGLFGGGSDKNKNEKIKDKDGKTDYSKVKEEFTTKGKEQHRLYFKKEGTGYELMIASTPQSFTEFINSINTSGSSEKEKIKLEAIAIAKKIDVLVDMPQSETADKGDEISHLLDQLSPKISEILVSDVEESSLPIWGPLNGAQFGTRMVVEYLTAKHPLGQGPTSAQNNIYASLNKRRYRKGSPVGYYVKGHLLNEKLGGPGDWFNLTPLTRKTNNPNHLKLSENFLKGGLEENPPKAFRYIVDVIYGRGINSGLKNQIINGPDTPSDKTTKIEIVEAEEFVPRGVELAVVELDPATRKPKVGGSTINVRMVNIIDQSNPEAYSI